MKTIIIIALIFPVMLFSQKFVENPNKDLDLIFTADVGHSKVFEKEDGNYIVYYKDFNTVFMETLTRENLEEMKKAAEMIKDANLGDKVQLESINMTVEKTKVKRAIRFLFYMNEPSAENKSNVKYPFPFFSINITKLNSLIKLDLK